MSLSVRTRFEVFKRDRFTCAYCGKHPPDVLLEVDHVIPKAAGGSDEPDNLVTACWDCNRGKADRLLEEGLAPIVIPPDAEARAERVEQARAYAETVAAEAVMVERFEDMVGHAWARAFNAHPVESANGTVWELTYDWERFPDRASVRRFLRRLPVAEVLDAVDQTGAKFNWASNGACRYFYAICWRRIKGES